MADRKITELTAMSAGTQATGDLLTIVDVSEAAAVDKNKKITVESLFKGIPSRVGIGTTSPSTMLHVAGTTRIGADSTDDAELQIGAGASGNRNAIIDLVGDTTYTDFGFRVLRENGGANTGSRLLHRGTGDFRVIAQEAAPIQFWTSNTERLRIDSSGKVGIGTSSPAGALHVDAASGVDGAVFDSGGTGNTNHALLVRDSGNNQLLRVNNNGNVGIGSSSPAAKLDVAGNQLFSAANPQIQFNAGGPIIRLPSANTLAFLSDSSTERMRIDSSGNVGIGTSSPSTGLHVKSSSIGIPAAGVAGSMQVGDGSSFGLMLGTNTSGVGYIQPQRNDGVTTTYSLLLNPNGGNVGIGTTSPQNKFHVNSTISVPAKIQSSGNSSVYIRLQNDDNEHGYLGYETKKISIYASNTGGTGAERIAGFDVDGLKFGSDTAAANALDDYEEGTWTPTAIGYSGTMAVQSANYRKVGSLCFVHTYVSFSNTTDSSGVEIGGLPFTAGGINNNYYIMSAQTNGGSQEFHLRGQGTSTSLTAVHLSGTNGDDKPSYTSFALKWIMISGCFITT
ncbi:endosialidase [uncultured Mediterranean phage uvMED]|nr:endosialidase [uncultured Mediterranean phage uvMED]BAR24552.1 endosialidase [uncultured Mediterranean phage uvMED]